jgi:hypothetical protein
MGWRVRNGVSAEGQRGFPSGSSLVEQPAMQAVPSQQKLMSRWLVRALR